MIITYKAIPLTLASSMAVMGFAGNRSIKARAAEVLQVRREMNDAIAKLNSGYMEKLNGIADPKEKESSFQYVFGCGSSYSEELLGELKNDMANEMVDDQKSNSDLKFINSSYTVINLAINQNRMALSKQIKCININNKSKVNFGKRSLNYMAHGATCSPVNTYYSLLNITYCKDVLPILIDAKAKIACLK